MKNGIIFEKTVVCKDLNDIMSFTILVYDSESDDVTLWKWFEI